MPITRRRSRVSGSLRFAVVTGMVALLVVAGLLAGCGGGSSLVIPPLVTGQSVIFVEVLTDGTGAPLGGANLNVTGPGTPQIASVGPGKFKVTVNSGATYRLAIAAAGFASQVRTVAVASRTGLAASVIQVIVKLTPALPNIVLLPAGGVIDATNGITVSVPAGAVAAPFTASLAIESMTASGGSGSSSNLAAILARLSLLPAGTDFTGLVEITIPRAFLQIPDALVPAGATFRLWEADATGAFVVSAGTAVYRPGTDDFVLGLPSSGSFQLRPTRTVQKVGDLTRDLGTLKSEVGGAILEGTTTFDYSTSSSTADAELNGLLTATFGLEPDLDLSAPNPPVPGTEGFITELTATQPGVRVNIYEGGALVGTADYYGANVVVMGALRPPPRTGTG